MKQPVATISNVTELKTPTVLPDFPEESPKYSVHDLRSEVRITFDLVGGLGSTLSAFVSEDPSRLYVIADRIFASSTIDYYWQFELPRNADPKRMSVEDVQKDVYTIHIPKDPGLLRLRPLVAQAVWTPRVSVPLEAVTALEN